MDSSHGLGCKPKQKDNLLPRPQRPPVQLSCFLQDQHMNEVNWWGVSHWSSLYLIVKFLNIYLFITGMVSVHATCVEVRGQLVGVHSPTMSVLKIKLSLEVLAAITELLNKLLIPVSVFEETFSLGVLPYSPPLQPSSLLGFICNSRHSHTDPDFRPTHLPLTAHLATEYWVIVLPSPLYKGRVTRARGLCAPWGWVGSLALIWKMCLVSVHAQKSKYIWSSEHQTALFKAWKDGSAVENTHCSWEDPDPIPSRHVGGSQLPVAPVPEDLMPSSAHPSYLSMYSIPSQCYIHKIFFLSFYLTHVHLHSLPGFLFWEGITPRTYYVD